LLWAQGLVGEPPLNIGIIQMNVATLRADCARCAGLCCVALAFDRSPLFAFHKVPGEPCPNLGACGRCRIHADRQREGFAGCVAYDCLGAGQRVVQEVFAGRSWLDDPALLTPMLRAFQAMREVHGLLALLNQASRLALTPAERTALAEIEATLQPSEGWSARSLDRAPLAEITQQVRGFLAPFRDQLLRQAAKSASTGPYGD
jgi:hypothetical protein